MTARTSPHRESYRGFPPCSGVNLVPHADVVRTRDEGSGGPRHVPRGVSLKSRKTVCWSVVSRGRSARTTSLLSNRDAPGRAYPSVRRLTPVDYMSAWRASTPVAPVWRFYAVALPQLRGAWGAGNLISTPVWTTRFAPEPVRMKAEVANQLKIALVRGWFNGRVLSSSLRCRRR